VDAIVTKGEPVVNGWCEQGWRIKGQKERAALLLPFQVNLVDRV
jgi:hypothetical protein